uniref:Rab11 family-interacting protein 3 n=1 Tax=Canis lupus familiaris TaxID=9615 RepID=A0A8P0PFI8_CANLF
MKPICCWCPRPPSLSLCAASRTRPGPASPARQPVSTCPRDGGDRRASGRCRTRGWGGRALPATAALLRRAGAGGSGASPGPRCAGTSRRPRGRAVGPPRPAPRGGMSRASAPLTPPPAAAATPGPEPPARGQTTPHTRRPRRPPFKEGRRGAGPGRGRRGRGRRRHDALTSGPTENGRRGPRGGGGGGVVRSLGSRGLLSLPRRGPLVRLRREPPRAPRPPPPPPPPPPRPPAPAAPPPWARARRAAGPRAAEAPREDGRGRSRARAPARPARAPRAHPPAPPRGCPRPPPRPERLCLPPAPPAAPLASRACAAAGGAPMKMEPGRPASPAGGARPDPDPDPEPEPGGPHRPAAAPAPRRTLGAPEPGACADARGAANPGPGPRPPCAAEPDGVCPPPCPDAAPLRGRALGHGPLAGGDVGLFPGFPAPAGGELALDVGPEAPGRPPDFGHPCPLATEPAACPEDGPRLRAVFDALDGDGDGLVRIEDFVQFATVYGADQVKDLTKYLDPGGLGVISFEDFYRGIAAIRNGESDGQLCGVAPAQDEEPPACPDEFDDFVTFEANEVTDSAYMGSESTYSECETFTDEDTSTLVHPELQPECLDTMEDPGHGALLLLPGRSHLHSQSVVTVIGGEEHFEDYGEGSEAELSLETLCSGEHGCRDPAFPTPSTDPLAAKLHSILTDEAFEFYCSQCHKQINRLEDLSARLSDLEKNRHLHQSGALTMESLQDPAPDPVEGMEEDIADKVVFLEKRVSELEKDTAANGEQHSRLRQENLQLVHRANALEEQLKEQELRACEMALEEARRHRELVCKLERERSIEVESLQARLQQLDEENGELRSCTPCLKANIERLEEEKQKLLDEIEELSLRLSDEQENRRKLGDRLSHERHQFQRDKEATQELIEDLRRQLEHLQLFKLEAEQRRGRGSSVGLQEYNSRTRESELEQEVRRLKQDNRNLKEQNDELNGQIINLSIQGAKNLFSTSFSESLAAEISSVSRDELMDAIQKQEEINFRLQDYIDRIIVAIMETNPSILEVK